MRRSKTMTPDQCATRMRRFLAVPAKSPKTRAYLKTLVGNPAPVIVAVPKISQAEAKAGALRIIRRLQDASRYAEWEDRGKPLSPSLPASRLRPSARGRAQDRGLLGKMIRAQKGRCTICGLLLDLGERYVCDDPYAASFDHVVPRAMGGRDARNRTAAHRRCNSDKGCRAPTGCERIWLEAVNAAVYGRD